jgi:hypothetical protein
MLGDFDNSAVLDRDSAVLELKAHTVSSPYRNGAIVLRFDRGHLLILQDPFPVAGRVSGWMFCPY